MSPFSSLVVGIAVLVSWGATPAPDSAVVAPPAQLGPPLLVVVERGPGIAVDAESVRGAIAAELGTRVIAPTAAEAPVVAASAPRSDLLLVAIRRDRLVLTLRGSGQRELTRAVAAPADRAAQLKVIAWLAGNLARDQLLTLKLDETVSAAPSGLPVAPPPDGRPPPAAPATEPPAPDGPPATVQPAAARPAFGPPPAPAPASAPPRPSSEADAFPRWTVTLSGGGGLSLRTPWQQSRSIGGPLPGGVSTVADVEVHRHLGAWFLGLVADYGPRPYHQIAGALLLGRQGRVGVVQLEGSGGVGAEQFNDVVSAPTPPSLSTQVFFDTKARAYARLGFSGIVGLARQVEAVAQLVGHLAMTNRTNAGAIAATLGLRLTLP